MRFTIPSPNRNARAARVWLAVALAAACLAALAGCYSPSCSRYAHEAIAKHGFAKGAALAVRRLGRCRPFGGGGYDPVP